MAFAGNTNDSGRPGSFLASCRLKSWKQMICEKPMCYVVHLHLNLKSISSEFIWHIHDTSVQDQTFQYRTLETNVFAASTMVASEVWSMRRSCMSAWGCCCGIISMPSAPSLANGLPFRLEYQVETCHVPTLFLCFLPLL